MEVKTENYSAVSCDEPSEYSGSYGVYIFENGKIIMHQSWKKIPTEEDLLFILKPLQEYYDKEGQKK